MAFATSNVKYTAGLGLNWLIGDWSGNAGDASGTLTLKGGRVYMVHVYNQDATSAEDRPTPCDVSVSAGTITVTVHNHSDVTQGRFMIGYL